MSSKPRRKVTVDTSDERKTSVFARLGPGGGPRKYDFEAEVSGQTSQKQCNLWMATGSCEYGSKCRYKHGPRTSVRTKRHDDDSSDDYKSKSKGHRDRSYEHRRRSDSSDSERDISRSRKDKETKIKSTVVHVVKKGYDSEKESLSSEEELEKKRRQIQIELSRLDAAEREHTPLERKMPIMMSSSSSSSSGSSSSSSSDRSPVKSKSKKMPKLPFSKKKLEKKKHKKDLKNRSSRSPSPDMRLKEKLKSHEGFKMEIAHKGKHKKKSKILTKHKAFTDSDRSPEPSPPKTKRGYPSPLRDSLQEKMEKIYEKRKQLLFPEMDSPPSSDLDIPGPKTPVKVPKSRALKPSSPSPKKHKMSDAKEQKAINKEKKKLKKKGDKLALLGMKKRRIVSLPSDSERQEHVKKSKKHQSKEKHSFEKVGKRKSLESPVKKPSKFRDISPEAMMPKHKEMKDSQRVLREKLDRLKEKEDVKYGRIREEDSTRHRNKNRSLSPPFIDMENVRNRGERLDVKRDKLERKRDTHDSSIARPDERDFQRGRSPIESRSGRSPTYNRGHREESPYEMARKRSERDSRSDLGRRPRTPEDPRLERPVVDEFDRHRRPHDIQPAFRDERGRGYPDSRDERGRGYPDSRDRDIKRDHLPGEQFRGYGDVDRFTDDRYGGFEMNRSYPDLRGDPRGDIRGQDFRRDRGEPERFPMDRQDSRFMEGRGAPPFPLPEFRDPSWDRGPGRRGGPGMQMEGQRGRDIRYGGRYEPMQGPPPMERQSRREDWEQKRQGEFYVPEKNWPDRRDERGEMSRGDRQAMSHDGRGEPAFDDRRERHDRRDLSRDDRESRRDERDRENRRDERESSRRDEQRDTRAPRDQRRDRPDDRSRDRRDDRLDKRDDRKDDNRDDRADKKEKRKGDREEKGRQDERSNPEEMPDLHDKISQPRRSMSPLSDLSRSDFKEADNLSVSVDKQDKKIPDSGNRPDKYSVRRGSSVDRDKAENKGTGKEEVLSNLGKDHAKPEGRLPDDKPWENQDSSFKVSPKKKGRDVKDKSKHKDKDKKGKIRRKKSADRGERSLSPPVKRHRDSSPVPSQLSQSSRGSHRLKNVENIPPDSQKDTNKLSDLGHDMSEKKTEKIKDELQLSEKRHYKRSPCIDEERSSMHSDSSQKRRKRSRSDSSSLSMKQKDDHKKPKITADGAPPNLDGSHENEVFSDWSEDADEVLNRLEDQPDVQSVKSLTREDCRSVSQDTEKTEEKPKSRSHEHKARSSDDRRHRDEHKSRKDDRKYKQSDDSRRQKHDDHKYRSEDDRSRNDDRKYRSEEDRVRQDDHKYRSDDDRPKQDDLSYRSEDDKSKKDDGKYRSDDERPRQDDRKYRMENDRPRQDDHKYRSDDDRIRQDDRMYRTEDDRPRLDDRKYRLDHDRLREDDRKYRSDDERLRQDDRKYRSEDDRLRQDDRKYRSEDDRSRQDDRKYRYEDDRQRQDDHKYRSQDDSRHRQSEDLVSRQVTEDTKLTHMSDEQENGEKAEFNNTGDDSKNLEGELEDISSGEDDFMIGENDHPELEEEGEKKEIKPSIVDILDIDWSIETRPKPPPPASALQEYRAAAIFAEIGVSKEYAGEAMFEKVKSVCQKQLIEDAMKDEEARAEGEDINLEDIEKKSEPKLAKKFELYHEVASFHSAIVQRIKNRTNLLRNVGPFRRGLCARRDLEIRRQLCRVEKTIDQGQLYPTLLVDSDLSKLSIELFKKAQDTVDK